MDANSPQPGLMARTESHDLRSTLTTPSTSAVPGSAVWACSRGNQTTHSYSTSTLILVSVPSIIRIWRVLRCRSTLTESLLDNLMIDSEGAIWAAGWPELPVTVARILDPAHITSSPSNVFKITRKTDKSWFYRKKGKYSVQKVLEDDGRKISGVNTVVHDATRGRLFMHGIMEESLIVCRTK